MVKTRAGKAEAPGHARGPNRIRSSPELVAGKARDDVAGIVAARNAVEESFHAENHVANLVIVAELAATREGAVLTSAKGTAGRIVGDSALSPSPSNVAGDIETSPGKGKRSIDLRLRRLCWQIGADGRHHPDGRKSDNRHAHRAETTVPPKTMSAWWQPWRGRFNE